MTAPAGRARSAADHRLRRLGQRLHERDFWVIQLGVALVAVLHVMVELTGLPERHVVGALVYVPPLLLSAPVAWAGLRYGLEGSVLTALWAALLTVPNLVLWHPEEFEWAGDLLFLLLVLALGVVIAVPVERERAAERRAREATARLHSLERDRLRSYAHEVTLVQEAERSRIARDLHDDVAQRLVVLLRHLDAVTPTDSQASPLQAARSTATRALEEVRRTSRDLRPTILDDLGLGPALEWLTDDLSARGVVRATGRVQGTAQRLPTTTELALFRIAQEALRNVERHAGADRAELTLSFTEDRVRLVVRDDGCGFVVPDDPGVVARTGRLGTIGMRERAELVGGSLELRSTAGVGTVVSVEVPLTPPTPSSAHQ